MSVSNKIHTENGAVTNSTTNSASLDFFGIGGALRSRTPDEKYNLFIRAYQETPILAVRTLFYFRDIRGGQGERDTFRHIIYKFALEYPQVAKEIVHQIPEYGRWDDLYALLDTPVEDVVWATIDSQLTSDRMSDTPSLLAKWLKSENTSSKTSRALATRTRKALGLTSKNYRKMLSSLRKKINIIETQMSSNQWEDINYESVPSKALMQYRRAFYRHDSTRFSQYNRDVLAGLKKINTSTLYPSDIVAKVLHGENEQLLENAWKNLPDYFKGQKMNALVVADTSGSMYGTPLNVAISLAMYIAERNRGEFHNYFMTFSDQPELVHINGKSLYERINSITKSDWGYSTNIESVFDVILEAAQMKKLSQEDIPSKIIIVSDMEFNEAQQPVGLVSYSSLNEEPNNDSTLTLFESIREKWNAAGYNLPQLIFWNVAARNNQFPMQMEDNVQLVSGYSPSILTALLAGEFLDPYNLMLSVLNSDRYNNITF